MSDGIVKQFDKRVAERYVRAGELKQEELDKHLKALPDDADNAEWVNYDLEDAELGDVAASESLDEAPAESPAEEGTATAPTGDVPPDTTNNPY